MDLIIKVFPNEINRIIISYIHPMIQLQTLWNNYNDGCIDPKYKRTFIKYYYKVLSLMMRTRSGFTLYHQLKHWEWERRLWCCYLDWFIDSGECNDTEEAIKKVRTLKLKANT